MIKEPIVATYGKIRIDNSDGTFTELEFVMPRKVAEEIFVAIIDWENRWIATPKFHNEYKEIEKAFLEKRKQGSSKSESDILKQL
mgnify:CR=1 FL=1